MKIRLNGAMKKSENSQERVEKIHRDFHQFPTIPTKQSPTSHGIFQASPRNNDFLVNFRRPIHVKSRHLMQLFAGK
jgi:hypothetical protein